LNTEVGGGYKVLTICTWTPTPEQGTMKGIYSILVLGKTQNVNKELFLFAEG
jgi:hypothetical protein